MAHKILVVDDDPNALRLVSYALQAEGYEVDMASSGAEALARLGSKRPDLIILDVMMPDMSGLEVCQRIRAGRATARLPILMLSARGLVADRVTGLKSGADDYLPKPADTGELIARVEALLTRAAYAVEQTAPPTARVLAFLGAKGGVGTTTVAVNVAAHIAAQGRAVCLVELRPGIGTAAVLLKVQPAHHLGDLLASPPAELTAQDIRDRCLTRHSSGMRLLAAPSVAKGPCDISAELAETLATHLAQDSDYVIFDLPAAWTAAHQAIVRRAHFTGVLCEPDFLGVPCARAALAWLQEWGTGDLAGVVVVNHGRTVHPLPIAAVRTALPAPLVGEIPPARLLDPHPTGC